MSVSDEVVAKFALLGDVDFRNVRSGRVQRVPNTWCFGRAVTVREITARRGDFTSHDLQVGNIIEAVAAGDVLVI